MSSSYDDIRNMSIDLADESVDDVIVAIPLGESAAPGRTVGKLANQRGLFRLFFDKRPESVVAAENCVGRGCGYHKTTV